jgi:hypothetical protein
MFGFQDVFEDDAAVHLVMELCEGGSVLDGLKDGEYSERQVAHIMRAVVRFIAQVRGAACSERYLSLYFGDGGDIAGTKRLSPALWTISQPAADLLLRCMVGLGGRRGPSRLLSSLASV